MAAKHKRRKGKNAAVTSVAEDIWSPQLDALAPDIISSTPLDVSFRDHALRQLNEMRDYERSIFDAECWKRGVDPDEIFGKTSGDQALK